MDRIRRKNVRLGGLVQVDEKCGSIVGLATRAPEMFRGDDAPFLGVWLFLVRGKLPTTLLR